MMRQGCGIVQADLEDMRSLSAALDAAAGVSPSGEREETLFAAAMRAYREHYTETGKPGTALTAAEKAEAAARDEVETLRSKLAQLERDIERCAALEREAGRLAEEEKALEAKKLGHDERLRQISKLEHDRPAKRTFVQGISLRHPALLCFESDSAINPRASR